MSKLPKYTLTHNEKKATWDLKQDKTEKILKRFETKKEATKGGTLQRAVGKEGGSVRIQRVDGRFQEERTYPRSADPAKSKG